MILPPINSPIYSLLFQNLRNGGKIYSWSKEMKEGKLKKKKIGINKDKIIT